MLHKVNRKPIARGRNNMAKQFQALESALNLPSLANDDDDQDADQTPVPDVEQEANDDMLAVLDHAKNLTDRKSTRLNSSH